ncbi:MAG: insulinase family protein [Candidatus Omnitrophica bacterium]|nr:insulinase family protein [Candidatus Omnitrophota bacterium]
MTKNLRKRYVFILSAILFLQIICAVSEGKEVLSNGLTVIIKEEHSHPVVTIQVTIGAGLSSEGVWAGSGISHFVEHMLFKGTQTRKLGQIEEEVKSYGGVINATTGLDSTNIYITVPKEHVREALGLLEDIVFNSAFDSRELEKEREVILKEIRLNQDDPARRVMRHLWRTSFLSHPYKLSVIGHKELLKALKRNDLVEYYSSRFVPNNLTVTVVGDVNAGDTLEQIESLFGKYQRKQNLLDTVSAEPQQNSLREVKEFIPINLAYLAMGYHTVGLSNRDLYALDVLSIILGGWDESRLKKKLVKDDQLLYAVSAFNYTPKYPGLFIVYGVGDPAKLEEAKSEIIKEIEQIARGGVKTNELEAAKALVSSGYINSLETTSGLAGAVSQSEFLAGDPTFFKKYVGNIKRVDGDSVQTAAQKYLNNDNLTISYLYPKSLRSAADAVSAPAKNIAEPARMVVLQNGIRLILKEEKRLPKLSIVCAFLGGTRVETKENNGISNLTSAMLLKGTRERRESEIAAAMESRGGQISHFSGKNTLGISLSSLSEHTALTLDMLEDIIKNSTFPEEELKKEKEKLYAAIKSQDDDVYSTGFLKLRKALFKDYPYGLRVIGEDDSLENITSADIKNFYKKYCVAGNMVIAVVGDFESDKMIREIESRLSDMRKTSLEINVNAPLPLTGEVEESYSMDREQSLVLVGFRGAEIDSPDRFYLEVLSSVLSGENGRLYRAIRNDLGLSYSLGTVSVPGIDTGFLISYVATDAERLKKTKEILFKELEKVKSGSISDQEVRLAKKALTGRQKISLQSYKSLAYQMTLDEMYGLGYDAYLTYSQHVSKITQADIVNTAKKYIDFKSLALVTILGEGD